MKNDMLSFLTFLVVGIAFSVASATQVLLFHKSHHWQLALIVSFVSLTFPFYYFVFYLPQSKVGIVTPDTVPELFIALPMFFIVVTEIFCYVPLCASGVLKDFSSKNIALFQIFAGSAAAAGTFPLLIFGEFYAALITLSGAAVSLPTGLHVYRGTVEKEKLEERIISLIRRRKRVSLEDVMMELGIADYRARDALYDLWDRDVLKKTTINGREFYSKSNSAMI